MWATAGSMAMLSLTIFMVVIGLLAFYFGFGLNRGERVVMALGMGTRNIAAVLHRGSYYTGCKSKYGGDGHDIWTLWSFILSIDYIAPMMGRKAAKVVATA